ncbi:Reticulon-like protein [Operophtera brumata]|uniref:Reticulon-like protein n=1 Tax=Operophtera brumata TaxID=104452 RepID=A0A0L7LMC9_OPEBR|nr:Reticulon-like protein [Operophtera brumata]
MIARVPSRATSGEIGRCPALHYATLAVVSRFGSWEGDVIFTASLPMTSTTADSQFSHLQIRDLSWSFLLVQISTSDNGQPPVDSYASVDYVQGDSLPTRNKVAIAQIGSSAVRVSTSHGVSSGSDDVCRKVERVASRVAPLAHSATMARPKQSPRHAAQYEDLPPRGPGNPRTPPRPAPCPALSEPTLAPAGPPPDSLPVRFHSSHVYVDGAWRCPRHRGTAGPGQAQYVASTAVRYISLLSRVPVESLIYWRAAARSGAALGAGLALLIALACCSVVSVLAYVSLLALSAAVAFRIYKNILQAVQKTNDGHPFNSACCCGASRWIALFTLPKAYEMNKAQVDANLELARAKINEISAKVRAAVPIGRKAESEKDK